MSLYLTRLKLRSDPSVDALKALLNPSQRGRALDAHHRLIWSCFAGDADRKRDFLWRSEDKGAFYVLSAMPPQESPFFDAQIKEFSPNLDSGDRLEFVLRANATHTRKTGRKTSSGKEHKVHHDIVMNALRDMPGDRAKERMAVAQRVATDWLTVQGKLGGFMIAGGETPQMVVSDYSVMALPGHMGRRAGQPQFGILEMTGIIQVTDPSALMAKLAQGFGRAKAFGCGLMMIRRAG